MVLQEIQSAAEIIPYVLWGAVGVGASALVLLTAKWETKRASSKRLPMTRRLPESKRPDRTQ